MLSQPLIPSGATAAKSLSKEGESGAATAPWGTAVAAGGAAGQGADVSCCPTSPSPRALLSLKKVTNTPERRGVAIFARLYH